MGSIFDEAKKRLTSYFAPGSKMRSLLICMVDELAAARLHSSLLCWQQLFKELDSRDFPGLVRVINEIFGGRGVEFNIAVMPGSAANCAGIACLSISIPAKSRVILMPLLDAQTVELCRTSSHFLGAHYWMEPVVNESPDLTFRQMVTFLSVDPMVCPPPLTGFNTCRPI